jgi:outer membrane receptor protein involved in Fe transport
VRLTAADAFELDVAAYRLTSTGEVRTVSPGVYENFGATLRRGIEANARWKPSAQLSLSAVYGLTDSEVQENGDARLLGLTVPGVPKDSGSLEATYEPFTDWSLMASWRYIGEYEVDALNTLQASSYNLLDLGVAYTRNAERSYRVYARLDNVADREYVTSLSVIGGQQLVAPGAPRSIRAGIQFNF